MIVEIAPYKQTNSLLKQSSTSYLASSPTILLKLRNLVEYIWIYLSLMSRDPELVEEQRNTRQHIKRAIPHKYLDIILIETTTNQIQLFQNNKMINNFQTNAVTAALSPLMFTHISASYKTTTFINKYPIEAKALLISYSSCGGFIVTCEKFGCVYTLNTISIQTNEKEVWCVSIYRPIQIDFSPCGAFIGILYDDKQIIVYNLNGFTRVCQDKGVISFCWMDSSLIVTGKHKGTLHAIQ